METIFSKFDKGSLGTYLLVLVCLSLPGTLFLYIHDKSLFLTADNFRFVLLSLSVTFPVFAFNTIIAFLGIVREKLKSKEKESLDSTNMVLMIGGILSAPVLYFSIILKYFLGYSIFWFSTSIVIIQAIELVVVALIPKPVYREE